MTLRLLLWAVFAAAVAGLAFFTPVLEKGTPVSASQRAERKELSALEIRLRSVDLREFRDNGAWNRLVASEAVYSYAERTIAGTGVMISLEEEEGFRKIGKPGFHAARAFWDFDRKRIDLPDGGRAESAQGWNGNMAPAALNLETRILHVPGKVFLSGPGLSIDGGNLRWSWLTGKITLDSPTSRILPPSLPVRIR